MPMHTRTRRPFRRRLGRATLRQRRRWALERWRTVLRGETLAAIEQKEEGK